MQERVDAATARYHELGDSIKAAEARIKIAERKCLETPPYINQLNITFNFDLTPYIEGDDAAAC